MIVSGPARIRPDRQGKLRSRIDAGYEQMVTGSGTSDIKQMALGVVDVFQIGLVGNPLDPLLQRDHVLVAYRDSDGPKFQTLDQAHRADRDAAHDRSDLAGQLDGSGTVLTALLARYISSFVAHDDPDSSGSTPSAIQSASHSPTATGSRSGSAKVSMMGSTPMKTELDPENETGG
jgi:hypothetical protein